MRMNGLIRLTILKLVIVSLRLQGGLVRNCVHFLNRMVMGQAFWRFMILRDKVMPTPSSWQLSLKAS